MAAPFVANMTAPPVKVLAIGPIKGQFSCAFTKIAQLHAKHGFSLGIVIGDLFNPNSTPDEDGSEFQSLMEGKIFIPFPVYFTTGTSAVPPNVISQIQNRGGELCDNLIYINNGIRFVTSEGIQFAILGGSLQRDIKGPIIGPFHPFYTKEDVIALHHSPSVPKLVDILVTCEWPSGIRTGSDKEFKGSEPPGYQCISDLCFTVKPKYHISISPSAFYEREPFHHAPTETASEADHITRFTSLAECGNQQKARWLYAFTLPGTKPAMTTPSPFHSNPKKRRASESAPYSRFAQDDDSRGQTNRYRPKRGRLAPPASKKQCYFCLSNDNVATHLVASVGDEVYMTTAKGPLSTADTFPGLGCPVHMLIIPVAHVPTLTALDPDQSSVIVHQEMRKFQAALNSMLSSAAAGSLGSVTWEVSHTGNTHAHWQYLAVPVDLLKNGQVDAAFTSGAKSQKYPEFHKGDLTDGFLSAPENSFRVTTWIPPERMAHGAGKQSTDQYSTTAKENLLPVDAHTKKNGEGGDNEAGETDMEGKETHFYLPLNDIYRFDIQFGRVVMAQLLGLEDRKHWQDCTQSTEDEIRDVDAFRELFDPYDFTKGEKNPQNDEAGDED